MKTFRIRGTRKTEMGKGYSTDTIRAKDWNHAVNIARNMGWGVKKDFDVSEIKIKSKKRKSFASPFGIDIKDVKMPRF